MELRVASLRFSVLSYFLKRVDAFNPRSTIQSNHSAKPLTPSPSPLKRGEGSKAKDVGKDEGLHRGTLTLNLATIDRPRSTSYLGVRLVSLKKMRRFLEKLSVLNVKDVGKDEGKPAGFVGTARLAW